MVLGGRIGEVNGSQVLVLAEGMVLGGRIGEINGS